VVSVSLASLQQATPLTMSFDGSGQADYYTFTVPSGKALLRLQLSGPAGTNFDVYAKLGSAPTTSVYDVAGIGSTSAEDARLLNPGSGTWYVMVRSTSGGGSYTLTPGAYATPTAPTL